MLFTRLEIDIAVRPGWETTIASTILN